MNEFEKFYVYKVISLLIEKGGNHCSKLSYKLRKNTLNLRYNYFNKYPD